MWKRRNGTNKIVLNITSLEKSLTVFLKNIFDKTLAFSIICSKCGDNNDRVFTAEEIIEILKVLSLTK